MDSLIIIIKTSNPIYIEQTSTFLYASWTLGISTFLSQFTRAKSVLSLGEEREKTQP